MKPPDEVRRELVEQWLARAEEDLRVAETLTSGQEPLWASAAFHAQQAAEKFLKAVLVHHQIGFPKTHDLVVLLERVAEVNASLAESLGDAAALNPFGVESRYPGDYPPVTREDARRAVEIASWVRQAIQNAFASPQ